MAITKIHPIKSTLKKALDYIINPKKTLDGQTVSSFACSPEFADMEFGFTKKKACKENGILAYHLIQSFAPDETDFKTAHEIGEKLCEKFLKGKYEYVISTHIDKGHIHNHIIFNSVSFADNMKYNSTPQSYFYIRRTSDILCNNFGLSVITPSKDKGKSYYEYTADSKGISWKTKLRRTIDEQLLYAQSYDDFLKRMGSQNYRIKEGKYLSFCGEGQEKFIRSKTLGEDYSVEALTLRVQGLYKPYKTNVIIDIQNNIKCQQSRGYTQWCQIHNLKAMAAMLNFLTENNMRTLSDLDAMEQKFLSEMTAARNKLKPVEARMKELDGVMKNIQTFRDNKERKTDTQKVLYKAALKELQPYIHDNKLPNMASLKKEYDRLDEQKQELSIDYFTRKDTLKEFRDVKKNFEAVVPKSLVREQQRKHSGELE